MDCAVATKIMEALKAKHSRVSDAFCLNAGIRLMRQDSDLILASTRACLDAGIPALPVHDSLIVPRRSEQTAAARSEQRNIKLVGKTEIEQLGLACTCGFGQRVDVKAMTEGSDLRREVLCAKRDCPPVEARFSPASPTIRLCWTPPAGFPSEARR
jgi:hypothetical protein